MFISSIRSTLQHLCTFGNRYEVTPICFLLDVLLYLYNSRLDHPGSRIKTPAAVKSSPESKSTNQILINNHVSRRPVATHMRQSFRHPVCCSLWTHVHISTQTCRCKQWHHISAAQRGRSSGPWSWFELGLLQEPVKPNSNLIIASTKDSNYSSRTRIGLLASR